VTDPEIDAEARDYSIEELIANADPEVAEGYLRADWFYRAMGAIRDARLRNGLKQAEVASRVGTTQSVIARMENAARGTFSVERFLEYAWACGAAPLDLEFVTPEEILKYALDNLGSAKTLQMLADWRLTRVLQELGQTAGQFQPPRSLETKSRIEGPQLPTPTQERRAQSHAYGAALMPLPTDPIRVTGVGKPRSRESIYGTVTGDAPVRRTEPPTAEAIINPSRWAT
jgi:transcriptional regulator with XRE-family HTH domain